MFSLRHQSTGLSLTGSVCQAQSNRLRLDFQQDSSPLWSYDDIFSSLVKCLRIKDQINTWTDREVHHGAVKVRWACSRQGDDSLTRSVFSYSLSHSWFPVSIWSSLSAAVFYKYGRLRPLVHSCFCFARVLVLHISAQSSSSSSSLHPPACLRRVVINQHQRWDSIMSSLSSLNTRDYIINIIHTFFTSFSRLYWLKSFTGCRPIQTLT